MPTTATFKYETKRKNLYLRVVRGHFATASRHSNYFIDVAAQKSRLSEAKAVAEELRSYFYSTTVVDTILCLDGTEVIGTCLADQLTKADFINMNAHKTIYVVTPETNNNQIIFRDNIVPMIQGKNVLVLGVSVSSGNTVQGALDAINYYGGKVAGIAAIFSTVEECGGFPVHSAFDPKDLSDYHNYPSHECPMCKAGQKIDALVNCHGFSKIG
ncbi:MAG: orotate phosphoribosyltransferase [Clostridia bacterium]|nr:orotate phosphoribosyltransferase [Clostridia bacterium]